MIRRSIAKCYHQGMTQSLQTSSHNSYGYFHRICPRLALSIVNNGLVKDLWDHNPQDLTIGY